MVVIFFFDMTKRSYRKAVGVNTKSHGMRNSQEKKLYEREGERGTEGEREKGREEERERENV